jgi:SAM-dependent methyltransferase
VFGGPARKESSAVNSLADSLSVPDPVAATIATYDQIAPDYRLTYTPEVRAWEEASMGEFAALLPGPNVLVPGCGDGRHSRYLSFIGLNVTSFDLSAGMLARARAADPAGRYRQLDLRRMDEIEGSYHGIWASGCLYHIGKPDFAECVRQCHRLLEPGGIFYLVMKLGEGEEMKERPGAGYPGGAAAQERLQGARYYAYYGRDELLGYLSPSFEIVREYQFQFEHPGIELWLRRVEQSPIQNAKSKIQNSQE